MSRWCKISNRKILNLALEECRIVEFMEEKMKIPLKGEQKSWVVRSFMVPMGKIKLDCEAIEKMPVNFFGNWKNGH